MKTIKLITVALFLSFSISGFSQIIVKVKPAVVVRKPTVVVYSSPKPKVVKHTTIKPCYRYVKGHWARVHGHRVWIKGRYVRI
ncbi:MAG: YXWGXW repeat-containing protein [Bacteroidetes bacterium]|nr:YXWGXW repeat-containing protein [Bacteroidota bacterium]